MVPTYIQLSKQSRKPATKRGPRINLRFRNLREIADVRRVAKRKRLSMNTYIITEILALARQHLSMDERT